MDTRVKGILLTVLSALLFGVTPVLASRTYELGSNAITTTFYREVLVMPVLLAVLLIRRTSLRVSRRQLLCLFLVGFFGRGVTTLLLYTSYSYVGIGAATTLHFMYPVFVALICRALFGERLGRPKVVALAAASLGVVLFLEPGGGSNAALGVALALCSSVTYAVYMVGVDKTCLRELDPFLTAFYMAGSVALGMLCCNLPLGEIVFLLPPRAFLYTFLVAVGASFFAVVLLQMGVRYLSATTAAVFSLFEPVSCSLAGAVWLGEGFTLRKVLGSAVILGAAGLLAAAKPAVSPDSQEALNLLMSREGFPIPREMPEPPESREGEDTISSGM